MTPAERKAVAETLREKHGMHKTPEYSSWEHMKQRCTNPNKRSFPWYGGRGISVHPEWMHSFLAFYAHVGPKPSPKHSLDRIDVNGNYEPGNVRWATQQQQMENARSARMVTLLGKTQTVSAWARERGLSSGQIQMRLKKGWSIEDAVLIPSSPGKKIMHAKRKQATGLLLAAAMVEAGDGV
jgi:hypothetical protein